MWTAGDVTERLRRELAFPRLVVKLLPACRPEDKEHPGRWAVCVLVPTLTGRRSWPVGITDDGIVYQGGQTTIREVSLKEEIVYVHEGDDGSYRELEPTLMRRELERRDTHHHDTKRELREHIEGKRRRMNAQIDDDVQERTKYYRKAFARFARGEETGL